MTNRITVVVAVAGLALSMLMTVVVPALLGLPPGERAVSHRELLWVALPTLVALVLLVRRAAEPLAGRDRQAARAAAARLTDRVAVYGAGLGLAAIGGGSIVEFAGGIPPRTVLALALVDASLLAAALVPVVLWVHVTLRPVVLELSEPTPPPEAALRLRTKLTALGAALAIVGIVPPALIGGARLDRAAEASRKSHDLDRALAIAEAAPTLSLEQLRARVFALPRGVIVDDSGTVWPQSARGHVETLVALGAPHFGWSIGFAEGRPPIVLAALLAAMAALVAISISVAHQAARRITGGLDQVRTKIDELARGELGEPLPMAAVHGAELRRLVEATNQLLARLSDLEVERFVAIERAVEADRTKTQFFANMSHDLRSPLTSILGFAELLIKEMEGPILPQQRDSLVLIRTLGEHVLGLLGAILDWARVSAGGLELHLGYTPAVELLAAAAREAEPRLPQGVTLIAESAAGLPQMLVDRQRAAQAIAHAITAVASHLQRGRVVLRARADASALAVSIEGSAQLPAHADRALEPYQPWPGDGLGLSLPLARRLVELHGGRMEVGGHGFLLLLPVGRRARTHNLV